MNSIALVLDPAALQPRILVWPVLFGLGAYLLLTAQPIGRPKPDLAERLRRLDVDERVRAELVRRDVRPIFASRLLEGMLRPVLDDLGRIVRTILARFGLAGGKELERRLVVVRPGVELPQFFGEKVASALLGLTLFPLMNGLGVHPFGVWPVWIWLGGFVAGFLLPDWDLDHRMAQRRTLMVMELPILLDMLTIATSAGLALEQALGLVARQSQGAVAQELQHTVRELALGRGSVIEVLDTMAERNAVPELMTFVGQLHASHEQGIPLAQTLATQAETLREQKRVHIVEQGGKATVHMILPVALFILPVLFVVLLLPAGLEMLHLGG
jgi:pilus assembly protein TadC